MLTYLKEAYRRFRALDERLKFLLIGVYNTGITYVLFVALYFALPNQHYALVTAITYAIAVTHNFLLLRLLVFTSKRPAIIEFVRCNITYGIVFLINLALLHILVDRLAFHLLVAQTISVVLITIISYLGHKHFSFREVSPKSRQRE